ncbi:MAG: hypothetical protein HN849_10100, partial [Victivallales bacterium]|nr:hypothetical protein [Victivallales bacterium]
MDYRQFRFEDVRCYAGVSIFRRDTGADEYTLVLHPMEYQPVAEQLRCLEIAYERALAELGITRQTALVRRFFASDLVNQRADLDASSLVRAEG